MCRSRRTGYTCVFSREGGEIQNKGMKEIKRKGGEKKGKGPAKHESPLYQNAVQFGLEINVAIKKNVVLYSYKALLFSQLLSTEFFSPATIC